MTPWKNDDLKVMVIAKVMSQQADGSKAFKRQRALSLKISRFEIREMKEGVRYIYKVEYARKTKQHPRPKAEPIILCHIFKHLIKVTQGIAHKCFFFFPEQTKFNKYKLQS